MNKALYVTIITIGTITLSYATSNAQTNKNKKSKYYINVTQEPEEFDIKGFETRPEKDEVEKKRDQEYYNVVVDEREGNTNNLKKERKIQPKSEEEINETETRKVRTKNKGYYTTYGGYRGYNESRSKYDKYYSNELPYKKQVTPQPYYNDPMPIVEKKVRKEKPYEREIKMGKNEREFATTVVRKRYTNLDVLCDDLDLAKIQKPVFKGICSECDKDADQIITNRTMTSLEKNYTLKQCYMLRDKRLRETLDDDQYRKWLRIKDEDEYLILTKNPEASDLIDK